MDGLQVLTGRDDGAAMPVASLWNIADPVVPERAKPSPIAWRHSAAPAANEGEMGRLSADEARA